MKTIIVFKATIDSSWSSSYGLYARGDFKQALVKITTKEVNGIYKISVTNADNFGLEKISYDIEEIIDLFNLIISFDTIKYDELLEDFEFLPIEDKKM